MIILLVWLVVCSTSLVATSPSYYGHSQSIEEMMYTTDAVIGQEMHTTNGDTVEVANEVTQQSQQQIQIEEATPPPAITTTTTAATTVETAKTAITEAAPQVTKKTTTEVAFRPFPWGASYVSRRHLE